MMESNTSMPRARQWQSSMKKTMKTTIKAILTSSLTQRTSKIKKNSISLNLRRPSVSVQLSLGFSRPWRRPSYVLPLASAPSGDQMSAHQVKARARAQRVKVPPRKALKRQVRRLRVKTHLKSHLNLKLLQTAAQKVQTTDPCRMIVRKTRDKTRLSATPAPILRIESRQALIHSKIFRKVIPCIRT